MGAAAMLIFMSAAAVLGYVLDTSTDLDDGVTQLLGWLVFSCVCLYMVAFAVAWGGVPWVYPSEIFPLDVKERAMSTSVVTQWMANFAIAYAVPLQVKLLKTYGTFAFY